MLAMLAGCATGYGPQGYTGGYTDQRIEDDIYRIKFAGNGLTSKEMVRQYWLYRCAELTRQKGYTHFLLLKAGEAVPDPVPQTSSAPGASPGYQNTSAGEGDDPLSRLTPAATRSAPIYITVPGAPVVRYSYEGTVKMVNNLAAYPGRSLLKADVILKMIGPYIQTAGKTRGPSEQELLKAAVVIVPGTPVAAAVRSRVTLDDLKYLLPPP